MKKISSEEAFSYLLAKGAVVQIHVADGEPRRYRLSDELKRQFLNAYDAAEAIPDHPPDVLAGALTLLVLGLSQQGFNISQVAAATNVLYPMAKEALKEAGKLA